MYAVNLESLALPAKLDRTCPFRENMVQHIMKNILGAGLLIFLIIVSIARNAVWIDDGTLWLDTSEKSPRKARSYNEIGLHAIASRDFALAIRAFTKSIELDPYMSNAYINIGLAYEGLNQPDLAILTYRKAIGMSPEDPTAYYNMGLIYYRIKNDRNKALELFLKARDLNPLEPDVHQNLGAVFRDLGRDAEALEEFRQYKLLK
jgi:tetratricopeptide (TPR) repeat protein